MTGEPKYRHSRKSHLEVAIELLTQNDGSNACVEWPGYRDRAGYGRTFTGSSVRIAHRVIYQALVGPVDDDLDLDHLCRNRACVNPAHLEPVTHKLNVQRALATRVDYDPRATCAYGHAYIPENRRKGGGCKPCHADRMREHRAKKAAVQAVAS